MICHLLILPRISYLPFQALKVFPLVLLEESFKTMLFHVEAIFIVITNQIKSKTPLNEKGEGWGGPEPCLCRSSPLIVQVGGSWASLPDP